MNRWTLAMLLTLALVLPARGQTPEQPPQTQPAPQAIAVAVLDFDANDPSNEQLGSLIGQTLTVMLTGEPGFRLVDRASLQKTLAEQEINLSGMIDTDQAVKVGRLVGAKILVVGKAFRLGKNLFLTAKLIGTETSLVDGVLVKAPTTDPSELIVELANKVAEHLRKVGPSLVAAQEGLDPLPALKTALAGKTLPVVAVVIPEQHLAAPAMVAATRDPAVETEIKVLLRDCGFEVRDVEANALADWARSYKQAHGQPWPQTLDGVDIVIIGEGFSEFAARIGNLVSCSARTELNVIDRATGNIVFVDRATARAVDLSENLAGRTALQKAGRSVGLNLLNYFAGVLPTQDAQPTR